MSFKCLLLLHFAGTLPSSKDSYLGDPLVEFGIYDYKEDTSLWTFKQIYGDAQW